MTREEKDEEIENKIERLNKAGQLMIKALDDIDELVKYDSLTRDKVRDIMDKVYRDLRAYED